MNIIADHYDNRRIWFENVAVDGISAAPSEENLRYFNVIILGPESSPYEGLFTIIFFLLFASKFYESK